MPDSDPIKDFDARFTALVGFPPFRWQRRLYVDWFARGRVPSGCDIPTGLGKTAVMAAWLIARAAGAALPRRLVYVVDRRAVVDQATRFAEKLHERAKSVLAIEALPISTLRGKFLDNRRWIEDPAALAVVVGTIDMIGSRLLFQGYGVSRGMRPFQAGLLGSDALFVLDEAHLCPPFAALLQSVATDGSLGADSMERRALVPPMRFLPLSATGRSKGTDGFHLRADEADEPVVRMRFTAAKRLRIEDLGDDGKLETALAGRAAALSEAGARVVVFCDRRKVAEDVADALRKGRPGRVELLVGARRVRERQRLHDWLVAHGFVPPPDAVAPAPPPGPFFLVATSAGEVGIDLDADHMVCDLVAYERMVQRLGRVNRRGGEERSAIVDVLCPPSDPASKAGAKYRGKSVEPAVARAVLDLLPAGADGRRDANPASFAALKAAHPDAVAAATTPAPLYPALDRATLDAWSLTTLRVHPGRPDPEPWLRGWIEGDPPQCELIWRRWLPWRAGEDEPLRREVESFFEAARPHASEMLETETERVLDTLIARAAAFLDARNADRDETASHDPVAAGIIVLDPAHELRCARDAAALKALANKANERDKRELLAQLAGAVVVVSASLGGLGESGLIDAEAPGPVPCLDAGWNDEEVAAAGVRVLAPNDELSRGWHAVETFPLARGDEDDPRQLTVAVLRTAADAQRGDLAVAARAQTLDEHGAWTGDEAGGLADRLGADTLRALWIAVARVHDRGKDRKLWQDAMRAPRDGRPYAKTLGKGDAARLRIGGETYRHEFGTLRDAESDPILLPVGPEWRELALHLIAAHHGHARPTITPVDPASPNTLNAASARDAALRFAALQRQWGPWGLAWLEAVLRAADQRASRRLSAEQP